MYLTEQAPRLTLAERDRPAITPAMIEAGKRVVEVAISDARLDGEYSTVSAADVAVRAYTAMRELDPGRSLPARRLKDVPGRHD